MFFTEWALGLEGIQSRKRLLQGRAGGRAGRDRQTVPSCSCCLHPPLTIPRKSCSWFCLQPFHSVSSSSCLQSLGGGGRGEWAEPQTSTDGSRYKAPDTRQKQIQGAVNPEGCTHSNQPCLCQEGTEETALPRGAGWETPTAIPGFTGALLYLLEQMYSASFSAFPQVSPSVCRPILFTGKQQQQHHLFLYMVIKVPLFQGGILKVQRRRQVLYNDTSVSP